MRPQRTPCRRDPDEVFKPGDPVEVVADEPGLSGAHFAAVVVARSHSPHGYTVQYDALVEPGGSGRPLRKVVPARSFRPRPPPRWPSWQEPVEHEPVDTLLDDAWWLGVGICLGDADEYGKVRVCFPETRKVMEFDAADVRPHLKWAGGSWKQRSAFGMVAPENMPYTKGMQIEVSKLEDNSAVAWLPAVVVETFWKSNLLVEYTALKSNSTALPEEIVDVKHVRPCPPHASAFSFCINDEVEAFQGGGWWPGVITDVNPDLKYTFKSAHLGVEVQLSRKSLRPRYDWVYESQIAFKENIISPFKVEVSSNDKGFGGAWFEAAGGKGTAARRREKQLNNPSVGWKSTTPESGPPKAASMKKRKTRADGPPDLAPSLTKKHKSPKLRPSEENKRHESSSKEIYPDLHEKHTLRDAPCPDDQEKPAPQPEHTPAPATQPEHTPAPASQPELTPASAQRRKAILKLSLPMIHPAASPDATFSPPTREIDAEKNEAVQNTVMIPVTEAAKSLLTPLDAIIKDLKDCREQWLQAQSQLDHSATKAKEMEEQVAKLQAAREADAQHLREVMDKQTSLERRLELKDKEIEDLKKKLVDLDEQKSCVEVELPRGAVMAASHALGVLKNHLPDLDIGILGKGYACTPEEAQALADQARPMVEHFVECLGLSVSSASEDEV